MRSLKFLSAAWLHGLLTWLLYAATGLVALLLVPPGGVASPLYLAAGIGLGAVLGWGRWMALPVGLGAATVVLAVHLLGPVPMPPVMWAQALVCGVGAALQVGLGARLILGAGGHGPLELDRPRQVARFMVVLVAGVSLVNATVSVGGLAAFGLLPLSEALSAWLRWWGGDLLGLLIGTPIMLTFTGRPTALWRARRVTVGLPMALTAVLLSLSTHQVQTWEARRNHGLFEQDVGATAHTLRQQLGDYLDALESMRSVYLASDLVEAEEFQQASRYWLSSLTGVHGLGWAERVWARDLLVFEGHMQATGVPDYRAFDGTQRQPPSGDELVLLRFLQPLERNRQALGFNVLSRPVTQAAFERARREDRPIATRGFPLVQETGAQQGVVIYLPVYEGQPFTPQARVQATRGAVFITIRMDDALGSVLRNRPAYLSACLVDRSTGQPEMLGGPTPCPGGVVPAGALLSRATPFDFAGAQWTLLTWTDQPVPLADGQSAWLLAVGGAAFAAALGTLLLVMSGHTRRIQAAMEEARAQRAAAESASQAKSAFLSRMSHELRTPLNAVLGFAQVMELDQTHPLPPSQTARVQQIQQAGWHLLDMIDDVLDISRLDAGTVRLDTRPQSVREALTAVGSLVETQARQHRITLVWPERVPMHWGVQADPTRLRQILTNLLSNAIKYNRPGGQVKVEVQRLQAGQGASQIEIAVTDNGLGMSEAQQAQLFQPFNRLGRESLVPDGTGIGLVISRHLAQLMGGELRARSEEGRGSTFTLSLPTVVLTPEAPTPPPPAASASPGAAAVEPARTLLLVEDNAANTEVIRGALRARPWVTLLTAATVKDALQQVHAHPEGAPELILLDINLPDASGLDMLRQMRLNPDTAAIPVVVISADALPEQIDAAFEAGASCYITKPVQVAALLQQIDDLLPAR